MKLVMTSVALTVSILFAQTSWAEGDGVTVPTTTADILAQAPTLQLLLDASGSSPATDTAFMASAVPYVTQKIKSMPLGSRVMVISFGDASRAPITVTTRLQAKPSREGNTPDAVARQVAQLMLKFPSRVAPEGETHAIGALYDAAQLVNKRAKQPNEILVLSDLIENSAFADCYKDPKCRLPSQPPFVLANTNVEVLGAGRGLPSDREVALHQSWSRFLDKTGATYSLKRTF